MNLSPDQERLVRRMRNAVVATTGPHGTPLVSPVWYVWDGERFLISTPAWTAKVRDVRRDPRIAVCVDDQISGDYLTAYGTAELVEGEAVKEMTEPLLLKYLQPAEAEARWALINETNDRVLILLRPERVKWRAGVH
jgi:PPOX class probable F420-dependent enzyme